MFENSSNNGHRRSTFNFMGWVVKGKESPSRWPPPPFWEKFPKNTVFFGRPPLGKPSFKKKIYFAKKFQCQQKIQAFTVFLHSLVYWRKRRPWTKKGTHIQKKVPCRTPISRRGPIWEQCKCWKPFLGVYMQLSSLLSRLWSEWGTGQDGGARPKFLQGEICHCFVNLL